MYAQDNNSLPVWLILSPAYHHISINSHPFLVGIVSDSQVSSFDSQANQSNQSSIQRELVMPSPEVIDLTLSDNEIQHDPIRSDQGTSTPTRATNRFRTSSSTPSTSGIPDEYFVETCINTYTQNCFVTKEFVKIDKDSQTHDYTIIYIRFQGQTPPFSTHNRDTFVRLLPTPFPQVGDILSEGEDSESEQELIA